MYERPRRAQSRATGLALGFAAALAAAPVEGQPGRPSSAAPGTPATDREWFVSPLDASLEIWSSQNLPKSATSTKRYYVMGLVTVGCQGPPGATWHSGTYKVVFDEAKESPRLLLSGGAPALSLTQPGAARVQLYYARPAAANVSCVVRASKPYGIDSNNAPFEPPDLRMGR